MVSSVWILGTQAGIFGKRSNGGRSCHLAMKLHRWQVCTLLLRRDDSASGGVGNDSETSPLDKTRQASGVYKEDGR